MIVIDSGLPQFKRHLNAVMSGYRAADYTRFFDGLTSRCRELPVDEARLLWTVSIAALQRSINADFEAALASHPVSFEEIDGIEIS